MATLHVLTPCQILTHSHSLPHLATFFFSKMPYFAMIVGSCWYTKAAGSIPKNIAKIGVWIFSEVGFSYFSLFKFYFLFSLCPKLLKEKRKDQWYWEYINFFSFLFLLSFLAGFLAKLKSRNFAKFDSFFSKLQQNTIMICSTKWNSVKICGTERFHAAAF